MAMTGTTLKWTGLGAPSPIEGIQMTTVNPDAPRASEGAPEWLVTNGLGGYACGTINGVVTRRFHGYLIASLPAPRGRTMMLNYMHELLIDREGSRMRLSEQPDPEHTAATVMTLKQWQFELGLPVWVFEQGGDIIEKRVFMPHRQNTVHVTYTRLSGDAPLRLDLRPWIHFRPHEGTLAGPIEGEYALRVMRDRYEIEDMLDPTLPPLRMKLVGGNAEFMIDEQQIRNVRYVVEQARGYDASGDLFAAGAFIVELKKDEPVTFIASVEDWRTVDALTPTYARYAERARRERLVELAHPRLHTSVGSELVMAADQFVIHPAGRLEDAARAHALGDEERTIIAGYHWFTDWGRDTMISLEGLTLLTGRVQEAGYILRTFAKYIKDGLIPNMFPEGKGSGLYHTADATLWFFHALRRYMDVSHDRDTLQRLTPVLTEIVERHLHGTQFGIHADPTDMLLTQGAPGYQLTWMDAKVGDLVVTPRRGKPVEINALWYNALRLMQEWADERDDAESAKKYSGLAERVHASFNARFWNEKAQALFDIVDGESGDDDAIRPNQIFSLSLLHPVLDRARWQPVVDVVRTHLLTPYGLRSLAPGHPDYQPQYFGDLRARDLAYHQGTVWPWLIGPFFDGWKRVYPERIAELRPVIEGLGQHLASACIGTISEIFDAEPPFTARGCCAQAWSVAEVIRVLAGLPMPQQKTD